MANRIAPGADRPRRVAARRDPDARNAVAAEDLNLRNDDADRTDDPILRVTTPDAEEAFRRRYRIPPGQYRSERDALAPGADVVTARLGDRHDDRGVSRIGTDATARAPVELGNGVGGVSADRP